MGTIDSRAAVITHIQRKAEDGTGVRDHGCWGWVSGECEEESKVGSERRSLDAEEGSDVCKMV